MPALGLAQAVPLEQEAEVSGQGKTTQAVEFLYVTDRNRLDEDGSIGYGAERGAMVFGRCSVTYSPIPVLNDLADRLPFYVPGDFQDVTATPFEKADGFYDTIRRWLAAGIDRKLVLFVHGYSFDFERACRRGAALQRGLGADRRVIMFTWPSEGDPTEYTSDATDMEWSIPDQIALVEGLVSRFGARRLQIVAHSMGARGMVLALDRLACRTAAGPYAADLVLIAPDIDREIFLQHYGRVRSLVGSLTLYASQNDTPLTVSEQLHGHPRLGQAGDILTVVEGMETIDVTPVGRYQITGHEYHYYHPRVAADLGQLLAGGRSATERTGLESREHEGKRYWAMQPLSEDGHGEK
jgi:esterase/lipase superfamily enzyme